MICKWRAAALRRHLTTATILGLDNARVYGPVVRCKDRDGFLWKLREDVCKEVLGDLYKKWVSSIPKPAQRRKAKAA